MSYKESIYCFSCGILDISRDTEINVLISVPHFSLISQSIGILSMNNITAVKKLNFIALKRTVLPELVPTDVT